MPFLVVLAFYKQTCSLITARQLRRAQPARHAGALRIARKRHRLRHYPRPQLPPRRQEHAGTKNTHALARPHECTVTMNLIVTSIYTHHVPVVDRSGAQPAGGHVHQPRDRPRRGRVHRLGGQDDGQAVQPRHH